MRALTVLFDRQQDAEDARRQLINAGLAEGDIQIIRTDDSIPNATGRHETKGLMKRLGRLFLREDHHMYSDGIPRGSALLTVWARKGQEDRALQILRGVQVTSGRATRGHRSRLRKPSDAGGSSPPL
jgi:hypothetical protein